MSVLLYTEIRSTNCQSTLIQTYTCPGKLKVSETSPLHMGAPTRQVSGQPVFPRGLIAETKPVRCAL